MKNRIQIYTNIFFLSQTLCHFAEFWYNTINFQRRHDMIQNEDVLNMNFYQKETFTGSYQGMRYLIKKSSNEEQDVFQVFSWPGPYNFASTSDDLKTSATFPFTPEGKQQVVDYLNEQWQQLFK